MITLRCTHPQINRNTHTPWTTDTPPRLVGLVQLQGSARKGDLHPGGRHSWATPSSKSLLLPVLKCCYKLGGPTVVYRMKYCGTTTHVWSGRFKHSYLAFLAFRPVSIHRLLHRLYIYMIIYDIILHINIWLYIKMFIETWMWVNVNRKTVLQGLIAKLQSTFTDENRFDIWSLVWVFNFLNASVAHSFPPGYSSIWLK